MLTAMRGSLYWWCRLGLPDPWPVGQDGLASSHDRFPNLHHGVVHLAEAGLGYHILGYGELIRDRTRMNAYSEALRQAVQPGCVVLDIGTGTGIFALLACRLGARRVYAVDFNDAIHVARDIAAANGYGERITFIQGLSFEVALPERADVIVSDLRGVLPLYKRHIPAIADARRRLLAPGGTLIPQRDTLWAAVVEAAEAYLPVDSPWEDLPYGFNMSAARQITANSWRKAAMTPAQFLAEPLPWATLDYTQISDPDVRGELEWTVTRPGTGHGLSLWFEACLLGDIGFSTAPGRPPTIYGQAFFPWLRPVLLEAGDRVSVTLWARLTGDDYAWHWHTRVYAAGQTASPRVQFTQSTLLAAFLAPGRLADFLKGEPHG